MARAINFFPRQMYMGHGAGGGSYVSLSEIFEITEEGQLDVELRVYASNPNIQTISGYVDTTSDPTFVDAAWKQVTSFPRSGTGISTATGLTGLGRFVRAKIEVPVTGFIFACMNAVAREL